MINLKLTQVFIINSNDFDNLVVETLGISNFESIAQFEWNNNSAYLSENINKEIPSFQEKEVNELLNGKIDRFTSFHSVLTALCVKEALPEGNYLIEVSW